LVPLLKGRLIPVAVKPAPTLDGLQIRLNEAARAWEAEAENARRLESRSNILITVSLAVAGFAGKAVVDAVAARPEQWLSRTLLLAACLGIVLVFCGFGSVVVEHALRGRPRRTNAERPAAFASASFLAVPPDDDREWALWISRGDAMKSALLNVTSATLELHRRNVRRRRRVQRAQLIIVGGIGLTLLAGGLYASTREPKARVAVATAQSAETPRSH
jgi:hypothetical protein